MPSTIADIYWAGSLLPEILMILFTQSAAVLHKYLNDELKHFVCYNFSLRLHRISREFPESSMFREIPEYCRFSRFVATLYYCYFQFLFQWLIRSYFRLQARNQGGLEWADDPPSVS